MPTGSRNLPLILGAGALTLGVGALLVFLLGEESRVETPRGNTPAPAFEPEKSALPESAGTIDALWDLAAQAAHRWREDARLVRLYASAIHPDGTINRATSEVQFVFVSKGLTALGPGEGTNNALRWSLSGGRTFHAEISQYPAPSLDGPEPKRCDLKALSGEGAPAEVILDASYAERMGKVPDLKLFTADRHFALNADPFTCEPRSRATAHTADELDGGPVVLDAGKPFDHAKASSLVEAALASASACKQAGGPSGPGTVSVRFDAKGKVEEVQFQMGGYQGTEAGRCLEQRLRKLEVKPWASGRGIVIKRFSL